MNVLVLLIALALMVGVIAGCIMLRKASGGFSTVSRGVGSGFTRAEHLYSAEGEPGRVIHNIRVVGLAFPLYGGKFFSGEVGMFFQRIFAPGAGYTFLRGAHHIFSYFYGGGL